MRPPLRLPLLVVLAGCAPTTAPESTGPAEPSVAATEPSPVADEFGPWTAPLAVDHPLVGTAWSTVDGAALSRTELEARVRAARHVLLGEIHDHPDHHRLQGEMLAVLAAAHPDMVVAYEMLDPAMQPAIDEFVAAASHDVDGFAELVAWAESGWPEWALYRPAFAPVIAADLSIVAAQFPRSQTKRFMSEGLAILAPELVTRYGLDQPLPPELLEPQLDEMFASHCEMVPREHLAPMVEIQRIRDAVMAEALVQGAAAHGHAALVAGTGHTRASGVPRLLAQVGEAPASTLSVGFVTVDPERLDPRDYRQDFDVIVWTPDVAREDPCSDLAAKP